MCKFCQTVVSLWHCAEFKLSPRRWWCFLLFTHGENRLVILYISTLFVWWTIHLWCAIFKWCSICLFTCSVHVAPSFCPQLGLPGAKTTLVNTSAIFIQMERLINNLDLTGTRPWVQGLLMFKLTTNKNCVWNRSLAWIQSTISRFRHFVVVLIS